jgi:proteic killer suppression protein
MTWERINGLAGWFSGNLPGFGFHRQRVRPTRYPVHLNGPWCVMLEWDGQDAVRVDFEQYHRT